MLAGGDEKDPTQENEHKMQIARVVLKCVGECGDEYAALYYCNQCDSEMVYCDECGPFLHRKKNHKWKDHVIVIPNIDINKYKFGERVIIDHIGEQNYRQIAPLYHAAQSQIGVGCSVFQQSSTYFDAIPKQIHALKKANEATQYAKRSLQVSEAACKMASQLKTEHKLCEDGKHKMASKLWETQNSKIRNSPFSFLYEWIYSNDIKKTRSNYHEAVRLSEATQQASEGASKALQKASECANKCAKLAKEKLSKSEEAKKAVQKATSTKQSALNSAYWTVGFIVIEMAWNGYKLGCDEIKPKEFGRLTAKSIVRNAMSMGVNIVGTQIGVGTAYGLSHIFGNNKYAVLCGMGIGLISGIIANSFSGKCFDEWFEARWPSEEKAQRKKLIDEALKYFHFSMNEIKDSKKFNVKTIQQKYRKYALEAHPDRNQGDILKWQELSVYYGILMGLLDAHKKSENSSQNVGVLQLDQ